MLEPGVPWVGGGGVGRSRGPNPSNRRGRGGILPTSTHPPWVRGSPEGREWKSLGDPTPLPGGWGMGRGGEDLKKRPVLNCAMWMMWPCASFANCKQKHPFCNRGDTYCILYHHHTLPCAHSIFIVLYLLLIAKQPQRCTEH